jgi:beta-glucanase (GH16 family)
VYKHRGETSGYADSLTLTLESTPTPTHPNADLELVWSDEFDGSGPLDDSKWTFEEGFQRNRELQWYQQENAFREHGMLVIEGRRDSRPNPTYVAGSDNWKTQRATIDYTSASVITRDRFEWRYGRLEVRAKVTNYTGTWPAIWTLGVDCEWPSNGEVDVMENYGGDILANFAWGTNQRWNAQWDSSHHPVSQWGEGWTDEFHLWALDWSEDQMTITLDGVVLNTVDLNITSNGSSSCAGRSPFRQSHYLLLNLALGGAGGSVDTLTFPTRYIIDYVRVYQ